MGVELEGKVWEPVPGATVTAEEFIAARSLIHEVHEQASWSSWVLQNRAQEYDAAWETCSQWKLTEPGPPRRHSGTWGQLEQRLANADTSAAGRGGASQGKGHRWEIWPAPAPRDENRPGRPRTVP